MASSSAITYPEQVCYERIIPQESHYYQTRKTPGDTGQRIDHLVVTCIVCMKVTKPRVLSRLCSGDPLCPLPLDAVSFTSKLWRKLDLKVSPLFPLLFEVNETDHCVKPKVIPFKLQHSP